MLVSAKTWGNLWRSSAFALGLGTIATAAHAATDPKPAKDAAGAQSANHEKATTDAGADAVEPATISANRPGVGETADVVGRGVLQFESGAVFDADRVESARVRTVTAPTYLLRVGLTRRLELQVAGEGLLSRSITSSTASARTLGPADVDLGVKARLAAETNAGVNVAVLGTLNLPTGAEGFTSGGYDPGVKLAFTRTLSDRFSVGGNVQLASVTIGDDRVFQHALSAVVAHGFSGRWNAFGEVFRLSAGAGVPSTTSVDGGLARVIGSNLQVDFSVGHGLNGSATDWFVAFGFAVRRPHVLGAR